MMRIQSSWCRRSGIRNLQALNSYILKKRSKSVPGYKPSESGRNRNDQRPSFTGWEEAAREEQRCSSTTSSTSYYEHRMIAPHSCSRDRNTGDVHLREEAAGGGWC